MPLKDYLFKKDDEQQFTNAKSSPATTPGSSLSGDTLSVIGNTVRPQTFSRLRKVLDQPPQPAEVDVSKGDGSVLSQGKPKLRRFLPDPIEDAIFGQETVSPKNELVGHGLLEFFRPLGIGKTQQQKYFERYDQLIEAGIPKERADTIARTYIKGDGLNLVDTGKEKRKTLNLTRKEEEILKKVAFSETLDKVFGAFDVPVGFVGRIAGQSSKYFKGIDGKVLQNISNKVDNEAVSKMIKFIDEARLNPKKIAEQPAFNDGQKLLERLQRDFKLPPSVLDAPPSQIADFYEGVVNSYRRAPRTRLPDVDAVRTSPNSLSAKIEQKLTERQFLRDAIQENPARALQRFQSRATGELPEVTGKGTGKFAREGDQIAQELGFKSSEDARRAFSKLNDLKVREQIASNEVADLKLQRATRNKIVKAVGNLNNDRRALLNAIKDAYHLTDVDYKTIAGGRDFRTMSDNAFRQFTKSLEKRGAQILDRRQAYNEVQTTIREKELVKTENLRKALNYPTLSNMNAKQLREFDEILNQFKTGDEFLSVRKIETVDNTDLTGIRTLREAKERLAKELGVPLDELDNIKVGALDRFTFDSALAEKNPFYGLLVDSTNKALLNAEARFIQTERLINGLIKKARKSRDRSILDSILDSAIPQDSRIFKYLESPDVTKRILAKDMTTEELEAAEYIRHRYAEMRDYLVQHEVLKKYRNDYITHIRRGFLEEWKETGILNAFKNVFKQYKQDEAVFNIVDDTGNILPLEKFFQFSMKRTGEVEPTKNVAKAFLQYVQAFEKKAALDSIVPKLDIYAHSLTPKVETPRGLEFDRTLKTFVNEWINTKKGRTAKIVGVEQGGKIDMILRSGKMFTSLLDLGLNIPVGIAAKFGENITTYTLLGLKNYAKGIVRARTKKGKAVVKEYENFIGRSPWSELMDASKDVGNRLSEGLFALFQDASYRANKTFLLGSMDEAEWQAGKIADERLAELRRELGRYRVIPNSKSIFGATSPGGLLTQYKTWAIPPLTTVTNNLIKVGKLQATGKEAQELVRASLATLSVIFVVRGIIGIDEDDKSFSGTMLRKAYRDALTIIGALDPATITGEPRFVSFVSDLGEALSQIITLEKNKDGELKGDDKLRQTVTPRLFNQFSSGDKPSSSGGVPSLPGLPELPSLPKLPSLPSI